MKTLLTIILTLTISAGAYAVEKSFTTLMTNMSAGVHYSTQCLIHVMVKENLDNKNCKRSEIVNGQITKENVTIVKKAWTDGKIIDNDLVEYLRNTNQVIKNVNQYKTIIIGPQ